MRYAESVPQLTKRNEEKTLGTGAKPPVIEAFQWERQPDESVQAYARFLTYRNTDPSQRSIRKLGISMQLAARWSKRHRWVKRTAAFDDWQLQLSDDLAQHAVLSHRRQLARLGSACLDKAKASVLQLDESKQTAGEIVQLSKVGLTTIEAAFGLQGERTANGPSVVVQTQVGYGERRPSWLEHSEAKQSETEVVGNKGEQVLAEGIAGPPRLGPGKQTEALPTRQPQPKGKLRQLVITAPVRREDDK